MLHCLFVCSPVVFVVVDEGLIWPPLFFVGRGGRQASQAARGTVAPARQASLPVCSNYTSTSKVLTTLGMFAVPCTAKTTIGEIRQKVQEWQPKYSLEQIELVCKDKDRLGSQPCIGIYIYIYIYI